MARLPAERLEGMDGPQLSQYKAGTDIETMRRRV